MRYWNKNSKYLKGTYRTSLGDILIFASQQFRYFRWLLFPLICSWKKKSFHDVSSWKNWWIGGFKPLTSKNDVHRVRFCFFFFFLKFQIQIILPKKEPLGSISSPWSSSLESPLIGEADDKERHLVLLIIATTVAVEICSNYKLTRRNIF